MGHLIPWPSSLILTVWASGMMTFELSVAWHFVQLSLTFSVFFNDTHTPSLLPSFSLSQILTVLPLICWSNCHNCAHLWSDQLMGKLFDPLLCRSCDVLVGEGNQSIPPTFNNSTTPNSVHVLYQLLAEKTDLDTQGGEKEKVDEQCCCWEVSGESSCEEQSD